LNGALGGTLPVGEPSVAPAPAPAAFIGTARAHDSALAHDALVASRLVASRRLIVADADRGLTHAAIDAAHESDLVLRGLRHRRELFRSLPGEKNA
jgi:hypothetical protein